MLVTGGSCYLHHMGNNPLKRKAMILIRSVRRRYAGQKRNQKTILHADFSILGVQTGIQQKKSKAKAYLLPHSTHHVGILQVSLFVNFSNKDMLGKTSPSVNKMTDTMVANKSFYQKTNENWQKWVICHIYIILNIWIYI